VGRFAQFSGASESLWDNGKLLEFDWGTSGPGWLPTFFAGSVSRASGLGKQPQVATRSWIPRIRRERRPELFGDKRRLLGVVEPISKQHERLTHLSRSRNYQTVELKLVGCSRYVLTSRIGRTVACV